MNTIYQDLILDHYRSPRNYGKLADATKSVKVFNPLCGDSINLDVKVKGDALVEIAFTGKGCALSQSFASLLAQNVKGKGKKDLTKLTPSDVLKLAEGLTVGPTRLKCVLLSYEALKKAIM